MVQVKRYVSEESGATSVEYAIMAALIVVAIATAVQTIGTRLIPIFTNAAAGLGS
jgi:pilus assembly protein Flp/PilA